MAKTKSRHSTHATQKKAERQKNLQQKTKRESTRTANREYKDTIFRMLFSDKKNLLSLYNAINHRDYQNPDELEIVTLENAVYMGMKNDLAFIINTNRDYEEKSVNKILL